MQIIVKHPQWSRASFNSWQNINQIFWMQLQRKNARRSTAQGSVLRDKTNPPEISRKIPISFLTFFVTSVSTLQSPSLYLRCVLWISPMNGKMRNALKSPKTIKRQIFFKKYEQSSTKSFASTYQVYTPAPFYLEPVNWMTEGEEVIQKSILLHSILSELKLRVDYFTE